MREKQKKMVRVDGAYSLAVDLKALEKRMFY